MTISKPLAAIVATLSYLAGIAGVALEAINVGGLPLVERAVITAAAGLLVAIGHWHASSLTAARAAAAPVVAYVAAPAAPAGHTLGSS
jgi:hypothetical protein